MRLVTEITKDNVSYCIEIMGIIYELRHLDGDKRYLLHKRGRISCSCNITWVGKPAPEIIYSNVKELVEHQQYIFDSICSKAIPA